MFKKSLTLTEIIIGTVILALVFGGLIASFIAVRRYVNRANARLVAANLGRSIFNNLYDDVHADWDNTGDLVVGSHAAGTAAVANLPVTIEGRQYTGSYDVTSIANHDYRQVTVEIEYPAD